MARTQLRSTLQTVRRNTGSPRGGREPVSAVLVALLAFGVVAWQHLFHSLVVIRSDEALASHLPHVLRDGVLAIPLAYLAVRAGTALSGRIATRTESSARVVRAAVITEIYMLTMFAAVPAHGRLDAMLGATHLDEGPLLAHAVRDALVGQVAALPVLLFGLVVISRWPALQARRTSIVAVAAAAVALAGLVQLGAGGAVVAMAAALGAAFALRPEVDTRTLARLAIVVALVGAVLVTPNPVTQTDSAVAQPSIDADGCSTSAPVKSYDVAAISVDIVLNRFGDHDPLGMMYVLQDRIADVRAQETAGTVSSGLRQDPIQALVIRANVGDCLEINFTNQLGNGDPASLHVYGLPHTAANDGGEVGNNPNSLADPGQTITYRYPVPSDPNVEGSYHFHSRYNARQTMAHGLFGTLVIEPAGSTYLDPEVPGQAIESGWEAIIVDPNGVDFREFVIMMHEVGDEEYEVLDVDDNPLPQLDDATGIYRPGSRALNYRSEPFRNRINLGADKSLGYSSYSFGDPATPVPRSYLGEPTKTRISHPGSEMFHVYHLHGGGNRWRRNPGVEDSGFSAGLQKVPTQSTQSTRTDSQSVGPGEAFDLEHECGAGGCQQAAGDYLFHCHIGQHYIAGMWSFWRVFDTVQPDLAEMPSDPGASPPAVADGGTSLDLIGTVVEGQTLVPAVDVDQPDETSLEDFLAAQLPPQGVTNDDEDATVWDWTIDYVGGDQSQPLFLGEPATAEVWANYQAPSPGTRPPIRFNLNNARPAWPVFEPHLAKRPPFAPGEHGGTPWLGDTSTAERPDGLCPGTDLVPGRRILQYPVSAIDLPLQISPTFTDPNGMLYVLNEKVDGVIAGTEPAEPLVLRSNVGDCETVLLTSQQDDANHGGFAKVNIHTHFVQFDPQASDGVVTGMSYEQGVRPYANENRTLDVAAGPGDTTIEVTNVGGLRVGIAIGIGLGEGMCDPGTGAPAPSPDNGDQACTDIRTVTAINGSVITLDRPLDNQHTAGEAVGVEFVQYKWYSDVDSGTVFFHDHVDFANWDHGLFGAHIIEPAGSTWHDPETGAEIRSGSQADIRTPAGASIGADQQGSFREQMVFVHNGRVDDGAGGDLQIATLNMRSEPLSDRPSDTPFSSVRHGDPSTPLLRAYVGDSVVIRGLGVVERMGALRITGHRGAIERFDPNGTLTDNFKVGISEREDFVLEVGAGGAGGMPGDYLMYSTKQEDFENGAWGLLRVHDTSHSDLQVLPGTPTPPAGPGFPQQVQTGTAPAVATDPGNPCPSGAPLRSHEIVLTETANRQLFALLADEAAILAGTKTPEPLVIRINEGDCLEVGLRNRLGNFASMNVSKLLFDPQGSHGSAIGFNLDSTVDRDARRVYRFYADRELGTSMFFSLADQTSATEGAYGAVVVEPAGSTYRNPVDGSPADVGVTADILTPDGSGFREKVLLWDDLDPDIGGSVMPYPIFVDGFTGFNFQADLITDGLAGRLGAVNDPGAVYDSDVHGDPANVLRAYVGDDVRLRVGVGSGHQAHVFGISGHRFPWEPNITDSEHLVSKGLTATESFDAHLVGGAGGGITTAGDYLFDDRRMPFHESGVWGLLRTLATRQPDLLPLAEPGMLRVTTSPAVPSQIVVNGILRDTWSTEWVKLQPGSHEVCFTDVGGFIAPPCETVEVTSNETTVVTGNFEARGFLRVDTSPALPSTISVDGTPRNDWGMWTDLPVGSHEVCFGAVSGFDPPACETVAVTAGATTAVTGTFTPSAASGPSGDGMLRVTTSPAVPSQISLDGIPMDAWSLRWVKVAPGEHEVCFSDIESFTTPACETVTVVADATTVVTGNFVPRGFLRVDTSPATPSTISVDGVPRDDWGVWTHFEPGTYEVCFGEAPGTTAPACESAAVTAGALTTVTGTFP